MADSSLLLVILVLIYVILFLHLMATAFYLYWVWWWYDIIVHFIGGFWIALLAFWVCRHSKYLKRPLSVGRSIAVALFGAAIVGILWEYFEYVMGFGPDQPGYFTDTALDLALDLVGAGFGIITYYFGSKIYKTNHV